MKKVFLIFLLFFISILTTFASNDIKIITREEWGADESYRYLDSDSWDKIFKDRELEAQEEVKKHYTQEQIDKYNKKQEKLKLMDEILLTKFGKEIEVEEVIYEEDGKRLAWPITKTKKINGIVIHHTASYFEDSYEGVRKIYKFHSLNKQWGDIGYNYLIGRDGEIFEGRAGGDYVTAAHDKWNNRANIGIAVIGNYENDPISNNQYDSLKKLTSYLMIKYDIDLTTKEYFHQECLGNNCESPLISELKYPIIGHLDAGHTSCPGSELYAQLDTLRLELLKEPFTLAKIYKKKVFKIFESIEDNRLIDILVKIEDYLEKNKSKNKQKVKGLIIDYFNEKALTQSLPRVEKKLQENIIKIKLSYPDKDNIKILSGKALFDIKRKGDNIEIKGKEYSILKIPKRIKSTILEITSWDRIPAWDDEKKYNDNKFRGDLYVYSKNNELVVVNSLPIEDYLKGLGEVSNSEIPEKIKTIIIAARTYATWYTKKDRKYPGEFYDGVDDPNRFQKYLGYGLEQRSPNINKIVDETSGMLITYNGELIKPWYFSNSDGQTLSFYDYCMVRYSDDICSKEAKKYPYFQSVVDKGSKGKTKAGHGVGISGAGVSYFAEKGWNYDMIIKYFLKGVEIL